jgi:hypothetical protein
MTATRMRHRRKRKDRGHGLQFFPPGSPYQGIARHARRRNAPPNDQDARDGHRSQLPTTPQDPPPEDEAHDRGEEPQ